MTDRRNFIKTTTLGTIGVAVATHLPAATYKTTVSNNEFEVLFSKKHDKFWELLHQVCPTEYKVVRYSAFDSKTPFNPEITISKENLIKRYKDLIGTHICFNGSHINGECTNPEDFIGFVTHGQVVKNNKNGDITLTYDYVFNKMLLQKNKLCQIAMNKLFLSPSLEMQPKFLESLDILRKYSNEEYNSKIVKFRHFELLDMSFEQDFYQEYNMVFENINDYLKYFKNKNIKS